MFVVNCIGRIEMLDLLVEFVNFALFCLFVLGSVVGVAALVMYGLAKVNIIFTIVDEGTAKIVVRLGAYRKTILAKKGYKLDGDGNIVPLAPGENPEPTLPGGIRLVGWPVIDRVFTKDLKWVKSLNGKLEDRSEQNVDFLLAAVDYQYGLRFVNSEDKDLLPLSGQMTITAHIVNPYKAQWAVRDWFDALISRVLPKVRNYISLHTYEEITNTPNVNLDTDVFVELNTPGADGSPSIISELKDRYGIVLRALETVNVDPPRELREATLKKWQAVRNAQVEAEETGGALDRMTDRRLNALAARLGMSAKKTKEYLRVHPEVLQRIEDQGIDLIRRDRAGAGLTDIRVANADGTSFESGSIASIVGAIAAAAVAATAAANKKDGGGSSGGKKSKKGGKKRRMKDMSDKEISDLSDEEAEELWDDDDEEEEKK